MITKDEIIKALYYSAKKTETAEGFQIDTVFSNQADAVLRLINQEPTLNFWKRLKSFVQNVQVNDPMSDEEKDMIIHVCNEKLSIKK